MFITFTIHVRRSKLKYIIASKSTKFIINMSLFSTFLKSNFQHHTPKTFKINLTPLNLQKIWDGRQEQSMFSLNKEDWTNLPSRQHRLIVSTGYGGPYPGRSKDKWGLTRVAHNVETSGIPSSRGMIIWSDLWMKIPNNIRRIPRLSTTRNSTKLYPTGSGW